MTKKDYIAIADVFAENYEAIDDTCSDDSGHDVFFRILGGIASVLKDDNSRFDRVRFYAHVGVCEVCEKSQDADGNCGCTNKDGTGAS